MGVFNVYCDESCHLENDRQKVMLLGAVWCPQEKAKEICTRIREIKIEHGLSKYFEIKWVKVSPALINFYLDIVDYFFDVQDLHFRALIIPDKSKLKHERYQRNHDDFYYVMYYMMLKTILNPKEKHRIFLDIKDTCSSQKVNKLREYLEHNAKMQDAPDKIIQLVQMIRSHEIGISQLADLLIGAVAYANREIKTSEAKLRIVERIKKRSSYSLMKSTLPRENKFNIFRWDGQDL
jgi:hypothetical protein